MWKPEYAEKPFSGIAVTNKVVKEKVKPIIKYEDWSIWFDNDIHGFISLPVNTTKYTMPEQLEVNGTIYIKKGE